MPEEPPIWPGQVGGSKGSQPLAKAIQDFTNLYPTRVLPRKGASRKGRVVWRNGRSKGGEVLNASQSWEWEEKWKLRSEFLLHAITRRGQ